MPCYLYSNPLTGETVEVIQTMNEPHVYFRDGVEFKRVFTIPQAAVDSVIDPFDSKDFARKTGNKRGTIGDLQDRAQELSAQREKILGRDPVKEKSEADWSKKRKGRKKPTISKDTVIKI